MRIGIDARFYGSLGKGLGRYTEKLIESLEEVDTTNEYVIFLRRENFDEYVPRSPQFHKVLADYHWYGLAEQILFPWLLLRQHLDLVHFPHFNVPVLYPKRFVVTIHDLILLRYPTLRNTTRLAMWYWVKFAFYRLVIWTACFRARTVITVSRFTESDLLQEFPFLLGKTWVTLEGADRNCAVALPQEQGEVLKKCGLSLLETNGSSLHQRDILQPYFLYVGNAYPHKNLEMIGAIAARFPEYRFVLVGRSDYFYQQLKRTFTSPNLCFAGFLSDTELSVLYRHAIAYVFPSFYEGFGLPPLEAMNYGLPVISSERGSLPEVLGKAALYFDPEQEASFERQIRSVATDKELSQRMRHRGYRHVRLFSWKRMAKSTQNVYREALS
jgi:glycosyltransferase involved in cell wall biosynthesis